MPAACPIDRSTAGTCGHSRTARYVASPANKQADPLRKPTFQAGDPYCQARQRRPKYHPPPLSFTSGELPHVVHSPEPVVKSCRRFTVVADAAAPTPVDHDRGTEQDYEQDQNIQPEHHRLLPEALSAYAPKREFEHLTLCSSKVRQLRRAAPRTRPGKGLPPNCPLSLDLPRLKSGRPEGHQPRPGLRSRGIFGMILGEIVGWTAESPGSNASRRGVGQGKPGNFSRS